MAPGTGLETGPGEAPVGRPNMLLVTLDTVRADRVGAYGGPGETTPHLDRLAQQATVFEDCVAAAATTVPSHATMLTGLYPRSHGTRRNQDVLDRDIGTLAERFAAAGYATGSFVSMPWLDTAVARGFATRRSLAPTPGAPAPGARVERAPVPASDVNRELFAWLSALDRPFFAWAHYFEPHPPWAPTSFSAPRLAGYDGLFAGGVSAEAFNLRADEWLGDPRHREAASALYDGAIHATDAALAALLDRLEASGLASRTVVVVTADHGLDLGDHGVPGHGGVLFGSVLRVPLVIRDARPSGSPPVARRVSTPVSLVDLAPTLLDRAGLEIPAGLPGRSLVPALRDEPLERRPRFAEADAPGRGETPAGGSHRLAVLDGGVDAPVKLILTETGPQLFDLAADPHERSATTPLDDPGAARRLADLTRWFTRLPARDAAEQTRSEADLRSLRALGYIE